MQFMDITLSTKDADFIMRCIDTAVRQGGVPVAMEAMPLIARLQQAQKKSSADIAKTLKDAQKAAEAAENEDKADGEGDEPDAGTDEE